MTQEQVIEKIKKLLALAASPNEHEAKSAMEMAQRLMSEYSVGINDTVEQVTSSEYLPPFMSQTNGIFIMQVIATVAGVFNVAVLAKNTGKVIPDIKAFKFFGYETNIIVAKHACDCVIQQGRLDYLEAFKKAKFEITFSVGFWKGFSETIKARFRSMWKLDDAISLQLIGAKGIMTLSPVAGNSVDSYRAGTESGSRVQIRPGVNPSSVKGQIK